MHLSCPPMTKLEHTRNRIHVKVKLAKLNWVKHHQKAKHMINGNNAHPIKKALEMEPMIPPQEMLDDLATASEGCQKAYRTLSQFISAAGGGLAPENAETLTEYMDFLLGSLFANKRHDDFNKINPELKLYKHEGFRNNSSNAERIP
jgi:hypothetical protein